MSTRPVRLLAGSLLALVLGVSGVSGVSAGGLIPAGEVPDIETFMQIGAAGSAQMPRSGGVLYFSSNSSGVSQIYRLDLTDRWPYQLTVFPEGVDFYSLSPTGDYLIAGVSWGGNENAQLWLIDARTGQADPLTESPDVRHGGAAWTSDGRTAIFRSNAANGKDFYLYRMDLATREQKVLVEMEGWNEPGDISDDDRWMVMTHWDSNANSDMYLVDLGSGSLTHLTPHDGESVFYGGQFDADASHIHLITNANDDGMSRLARMDLKTRAITFLDPDGRWEAGSVGVSPSRDILGYTLNEDGYSRLYMENLVTGETIPAPPVDGQIAGFLFTDDNTVVFGFASATSTNDIWQWEWKVPALEKLTHSTYAGVDPRLFSDPKLIRYASFDGLEIPAFLYLPPGRKAGDPVPFVVHMHGGPESQFTPGFIRHFQYLVLNGYGILAPNVRGSSGYGQEYMGLDNYKNRLDSVKDMKAGVDWLIAEGYSAPGMIAVKGGSYGGYMTMAGITEYPGLFSAAINSVGITNFVTFLENTADYRRHLREAEYGPLTDRPFLESISPLNKAELIETPLLVVHGENDPRVPVGEARQIEAAIQAKGGVVETLIFPDEGHGVSKRPNVLTQYRKMVEFLDQHLKPGKPGRSGTE